MDHGVRATNLELHWDKYEISEGVFDWDYINHQRDTMVFLRSHGWYVQLVPGYHYVPEWVFLDHPDFYLTNQYGEIYNPDPNQDNDLQATNAPFNPQARALIANYLEHLLTVGFPE
jgi:beta-galactosidase GanA